MIGVMLTQSVRRSFSWSYKDCLPDHKNTCTYNTNKYNKNTRNTTQQINIVSLIIEINTHWRPRRIQSNTNRNTCKYNTNKKLDITLLKSKYKKMHCKIHHINVHDVHLSRTQEFLSKDEYKIHDIEDISMFSICFIISMFWFASWFDSIGMFLCPMFCWRNILCLMGVIYSCNLRKTF